jgi:heme exporter protein C
MATFAKYFLGVWIAACVTGAFLWLGDVPNFPDPQLARVVALHLPNAMVVMIASVMAAAYGWRYLVRGRNPLDDSRSKVAAVLTMLFCLLTTVTGSIFAKVQWGAYWNWDPKQICIFVLMLIYAAYFVLRGGIEDPDRRGVISAVYVLFAAVMTPLLGYVIPKYLPSLHPTNTHFDGRYHLVIWSMTAGLIGLYSWLFSLAVRQERAQLALDELAAEGDF